MTPVHEHTQTPGQRRLRDVLERIRRQEEKAALDTTPTAQAAPQPSTRPVPGTLTPEEAQTRQIEQGTQQTSRTPVGRLLEKTTEPTMRALELAARPFQIAGALTGPLITPALRAAGFPEPLAESIGGRQEGQAILDLGQRLLSGEITPRDFAGQLIAIQESKPIPQQLLSELPAALIPPIGAVQKGTKAIVIIERLAADAVKKGRLRVGEKVAKIPGVGEVGLRVAGRPGIEGAAEAPRRLTRDQFLREQGIPDSAATMGDAIAIASPGGKRSPGQIRRDMQSLQPELDRQREGFRAYQQAVDEGSIVDPSGEFRPRPKIDPNIAEIQRLEAQATDLEGLASRGMRPRVHRTEAAQLRVQAEQLKDTGGRVTPPTAPPLSAAGTGARPPATGLQTSQRLRGQAGVSGGGQSPRLPPKVVPDGGMVPLPDFDATRAKLVGILQTSVRRSQKELEALRAAERKRRAAMVEAGFQRARATGEPPIARIRGAQRGEFPTPELAMSERITADEVTVLRNSIYDSLGPELRQTAANVDEALTALAVEGKIPTPSELKWMEEVFGDDFTGAILSLRSKGEKATEIALEIWNLPRALLASFDDSAVLRQGAMLLPEGSPVVKAWLAHVKAFKKTGFDALNDGVRANTWFRHAQANGLDLTLPSAAGRIGGREEPFFGARLASRIPILGKGIEISERLYSGYLNKLRMDVYASHAAELTRLKASPNAFEELAQNINILSGRASLGKAEALAPFLNGMFFSAKLNWARAQAPFRILRQAPNLGTAEGRSLAKMLAKDVYGYWAGIVGMLSLASAAGVATVSWNRLSSDFGKMQIGTVRVDPWAGSQQFAVLIARLIAGERVTTTTRRKVPADMVDTLARFIESKLHPALGQLIAIKRGRTFIGEDLTVNEYAKMWMPLFAQDIREVFEGTNPGIATALGIAAFEGVSVYNIPGVPAALLNQFQAALDEYDAIPTDALERGEDDPSRSQYRKSNPDADASLFLAGRVRSLRSNEAVAAVAALIQEHGINPDHIRGIDERKERQADFAKAGRELKANEVDDLIALLETSTPISSQQTPATPLPQLREGAPSPAGPSRIERLRDILERQRATQEPARAR